jgi:hypothetical protein
MKTNGGWSLNNLLLGIGVLAFALIFITIKIQSVASNLTDDKFSGVETKKEKLNYTYDDMEQKLVVAATRYMDETYEKIAEGSTKITMDELNIHGVYNYIRDPKDSNKKCVGYVIYNKNGNEISYKPYIKCSNNYQTKGYK